jgi:hypothetical protein
MSRTVVREEARSLLAFERSSVLAASRADVNGPDGSPLTRLRSPLGRSGQQRSPRVLCKTGETHMHSFDFDEIVIGIAKRTQLVTANATGADRYQRLSARLEQLYDVLELARLLGYRQLARRIETHIDALRPLLDQD